MDHCVLYDQCLNSLGVSKRKVESNRTTIVLHVKAIPIERQRLGKCGYGLGQMLKRVLVKVAIRHLRMTEPWIVRRDTSVRLGQQWQQRIEHA
ncbi:hypothetical protein D3C84_986970 [compost metagenome]